MPLKIGFGEYSPDELIGFANTLKANTDGVALWTPLAAKLADVETKRAALYAVMPGSGTGHTAQVNAAAAALATALSTVADDINELAAATEPDREALGLPMVRARTRATTPPDAPGNLRLRHGSQPGRVDGSCEPAGDNIRGYEAQWTLDPNDGTSWSSPETFPNSRSITFSGLQRGKDIWVRVRARNTIGAGPWSDPATIMVT